MGNAEAVQASHKFNAAGLCYELAIAINSDRLVWIAGPYPAATHDITIFHDGLMAMMPEGKRAIGDSGYRGEPDKVSITHDDDDGEVKKFKARAKSRQETFNGRINNFRVLKLPFRHDHRSRHQASFEACCVCIQLDIEMENGLFDV